MTALRSLWSCWEIVFQADGYVFLLHVGLTPEGGGKFQGTGNSIPHFGRNA